MANNWIHLTGLYAKLQEQMNYWVLMDWLIHSDLVLTADPMAVDRMIMVINNVLR